MFYIVETQEQLDRLVVYKDDDCFLHLIARNDSSTNLPCLMYYRPLSASHGFMLSHGHPESSSRDSFNPHLFSKSLTGKIWMLEWNDKHRNTLHWNNINDVNLLFTLSGKSILNVSSYDTPAHRHYKSMHYVRNDVNKLIPISKHYEKWENIYDDLDFTIPEGYDFYADVVSPCLSKIGRSGIVMNVYDAFKYFPNNKFNIGEGIGNRIVYSSYNLHHATGRPSCTGEGINLMALPKSNGARSIITPRFTYLVEFDYKSYQIRLLADMIGYSFDSGNIHEELAKQYFNTDMVTPEQYEEGKKMTFRHSYGRSTEPPDSPFFKEVYALRDGLWSFNQQNGYIISPISGRRLYGITKLTQVLPHLMQCLETERNALVLQDIHTYLKGKRSRIILYQYDSFLFDVHFREGTQLVGEINDILEKDGYQTTVSFGYNYHEMNKTIIS